MQQKIDGLFCPRYAAQRNLLLTAAARILGETWSSSSDARKIIIFLFGVKSVNYDINSALFREVQTLHREPSHPF